MAKDRSIEQIFPIQCRGRDAEGASALREPVAVKVSVVQWFGDDTTISLSVKCPYNTGGHGQRCKASHPDVDKVGNGIACRYAIDIPYFVDGVLSRLN